MRKQSVLITGVSSGIGYDAVRYLVKQGYFVFGSVRNTKAQEKVNKEFPDGFQSLIFDVTDSEAIAKSVDLVKEKLGDSKLFALVNNAGLAVSGPMQLLDDESFRYQMDVNLFGARNVTNAFLPLLGAEPGRAVHSEKPPPITAKIINISSISGILNTPVIGSYCVAKHAMESLGEVYRRELMQYGIDVVSIQSGPIQSKIWEKNVDAMDSYSDSDYAPMIKKNNQFVAKSAKDALPAEAISRLILKALETKKPKTAYFIHPHPLIPWLLAKVMPARMADRLIWRTLSK